MGTRSDIIALRADGKWQRIYCHWDGYLEHNGKILFEHYTGQKQVEKLVALGNLSILGEKIGVKHPFDKPRYDTPEHAEYEKKYAGMCLAYIRDRGLGNWHFAKTKAEFIKSEGGEIGDKLFDVMPEEDSWTEFTYIWCANPTVTDAQPTDQAKWWVGVPGESAQTFIDLGDALLGKKTIAAPVKVFGAVIGQHSKTAPDKPHGWRGA